MERIFGTTKPLPRLRSDDDHHDVKRQKVTRSIVGDMGRVRHRTDDDDGTTTTTTNKPTKPTKNKGINRSDKNEPVSPVEIAAYAEEEIDSETAVIRVE